MKGIYKATAVLSAVVWSLTGGVAIWSLPHQKIIEGHECRVAYPGQVELEGMKVTGLKNRAVAYGCTDETQLGAWQCQVYTETCARLNVLLSFSTVATMFKIASGWWQALWQVCWVFCCCFFRMQATLKAFTFGRLCKPTSLTSALHLRFDLWVLRLSIFPRQVNLERLLQFTFPLDL